MKMNMSTSVSSATALFAAIMLAGCATTPKSYNPEMSRALNLARAGGIYDQDLRDSEDGWNSYKQSLLMKALNVTSLASSLDAPLRGLNGQQTLMFNTASILTSPDNPSARPSLMAWMPASMAKSSEDAYSNYINLIDNAVAVAAKSMNLDLTKIVESTAPKIDGNPLIMWAVMAPQFGCDGSNCVIAYNVTMPNPWKTPAFVGSGNIDSFNLAANNTTKYSRLIFTQVSDVKSFPMDDFYKSTSRALPEWAVMYFPPNSVFQDGKALPYPVIYEKGQQLLFRKAQ
ncbi:hypothetical protein ACQ9QL_004860 [Salmonella enterica subsp. enterica serovar Agona]|uniref:S013 n=3 Tax=Salmonella enterica TaxID=28901 RepID=A0A3W0D1G3_SALET|nr:MULTISPECIES: hypothetical protein [Gammaproteobacteria]EAO4365055.1 hypothetical protein [Salmonella enterica subsp. enterica serovar Bere]EBN7510403.1 hypothetical protein [Salmonella enterica subsp. enterica serovar Tennessee]EDA2201308.1 hypothetical protein [Salmonella enterica subsp. enterica serovar Derby]EDR0618794.1 hypothetical protein [Salmonella enterica subsp. enterica serovar Cubana]EDR5650570.1 hypothetical protein [Salmonella enterica subsp. enterica serovar Livingstone]EEA